MKRLQQPLLSLLLVFSLFAALSSPAFADNSISNQIISGPGGTAAQQSSAPTLRSLLNRAANKQKLKYPDAYDYYTQCVAMYIDAPKGHSIEALNNWDGSKNRVLGYVYHGSRVYVVAEHGDASCVLYYSEKNVLNAAWVSSKHLSYTYPGRVYRLGASRSNAGANYIGDLIGSWSKDNFVGTRTKFTVLDEAVEDCVGFTLDYQLITKTAGKDEVLGPRSVYVNDGRGWVYVGDFDYNKQGACHVEVTLDSPMDLLAVATVADVREPNGFTFRQSLLDVISD